MKKVPKPRELNMSACNARAVSDENGDVEKFIMVSGAYLDCPKEVSRLIKFLEKAKRWLK